MPELPEVEIVRRGLERLLVGKRVATVSSTWPKNLPKLPSIHPKNHLMSGQKPHGSPIGSFSYLLSPRELFASASGNFGDIGGTGVGSESFPNADAEVRAHLIDATITAVRRRAKLVLIDLDTNYSLLIHLKLTGQLVYRSEHEHFGAGHPSESLVGELPDRSTRVVIDFTDGSKLFFNDQRKFGWMRLLPTGAIGELAFFQKVGPEPLSTNFTAHDFVLRLRRRERSVVKAALLDQTVIAGVGNIYADESLFGAKIHPATRVHDLTDAQLTKLYHELQAVLRLAIKKGGSTDRTYVNAEGQRGSYLSFARVFRREGQPCPRCGHIIIKTRVAGRGTHLCPYCQRLVE